MKLTLKQPSIPIHPIIIWFTGLSGSGKTTISKLVYKKLKESKYPTILLDGDKIRKGLSSDLGFSDSDRSENIRRIKYLCKLLRSEGFNVVASFISPFRSDRAKLRNCFREDFVEVYCKRSLKECEKNDIKGLYNMARENKIKNFTGISSIYEPPIKPEIVLDINLLNKKQCVNKILNFVINEYKLKITND